MTTTQMVEVQGVEPWFLVKPGRIRSPPKVFHQMVEKLTNIHFLSFRLSNEFCPGFWKAP